MKFETFYVSESDYMGMEDFIRGEKISTNHWNSYLKDFKSKFEEFP